MGESKPIGANGIHARSHTGARRTGRQGERLSRRRWRLGATPCFSARVALIYGWDGYREKLLRTYIQSLWQRS